MRWRWNHFRWEGHYHDGLGGDERHLVAPEFIGGTAKGADEGGCQGALGKLGGFSVPGNGVLPVGMMIGDVSVLGNVIPNGISWPRLMGAVISLVHVE